MAGIFPAIFLASHPGHALPNGTNFQPRKILFTIFLDAIFTSFVVALFTNSSDAARATTAKSCVMQKRISD
jgi:hypothetical protein